MIGGGVATVRQQIDGRSETYTGNLENSFGPQERRTESENLVPNLGPVMTGSSASSDMV